MKSTEMLDQIKTLLNIEVKLEEMKLENGTIVSAESFEKDKEIFIVTDDEKVAMPVGEYLLEDGRLVVVEEEGRIADVREVSDEVPEKETEEGEEITSDLKDEEEVEMDEDVSRQPKSRTVKEEFSEAASKPIKHNPEGEGKTKKRVEFAKGKFNTTLDRVLNKLNK